MDSTNQVFAFVCWMLLCSTAVAFLTTSGNNGRRFLSSLSMMDTTTTNEQPDITTRRSIIQSAILTTFGGSMLLQSQPAYALPTITADEFDIILRDSARSIDVVQFSGPKSENVKVLLLDGTAFGISGIVESSTDPRSPFKIAAQCRDNGVRTKFVDYEAALATVTFKKKVVYTNSRVQEANLREQEKQLRLQQDEENRLLELARLEKLEKESQLQQQL